MYRLTIFSLTKAFLRLCDRLLIVFSYDLGSFFPVPFPQHRLSLLLWREPRMISFASGFSFHLYFHEFQNHTPVPIQLENARTIFRTYTSQRVHQVPRVQNSKSYTETQSHFSNVLCVSWWYHRSLGFPFQKPGDNVYMIVPGAKPL